MTSFIFLPIVSVTDNKNDHRINCVECGVMFRSFTQVRHKYTCSYAIKCHICNRRLDLKTSCENSHIHFKHCLRCGFNFEPYLLHRFDCPIIKHCQCMQPVNMDLLKCNCSSPNATCF